MFNPTAVVTDSFCDHLAETFLQAYPEQNAHLADVLNQIARETLGHINTSDALYHNAEHTMLVTLVGQQIILGQLSTRAGPPEDWVHYVDTVTRYAPDVTEQDIENLLGNEAEQLLSYEAH